MHDTDRGRFKNFHKIFKRPRCVCRRSEICTIYECESSNSISSAGEKSLMLFPKIKVFSIFNPYPAAIALLSVVHPPIQRMAGSIYLLFIIS